MAGLAARSATVIMAVLVGLVGNGIPPAVGSPTQFTASPPLPVAPVAGMDWYADPVNGWSISYPMGWQVDGSDPARVLIHDPENLAVVSVRVMPADLPLNAFAKMMLGSDVVKRRELISLPNGTPAIDFRAEIGTDKRSHQLYLESAGKAFEVKGEASVASWQDFSADFDTILMSFVPPAGQ